MRILIVSDTHRKDGNLTEVLDRAGKIDLFIHCGDVEGSEAYIRRLVKCPIHMVAGNNDFFSDLPREEEFMIGSYKVWLTHGHNYYVSMGNETIREEAQARGIQIVMYGHTHKPCLEQGKTPLDVTAVNPGSLSYPRQEGRRPSWILMELDDEGNTHYHMNYL